MPDNTAADGILDYTAAQFNSAQAIINQRYGEAISLHLADNDDPINPCPALFWTARGCNFIVLKTAEAVFAARYFYKTDAQFSTVQQQFNTLEDCVSAVLQAQIDHAQINPAQIDPAKSGGGDD